MLSAKRDLIGWAAKEILDSPVASYSILNLAFLSTEFSLSSSPEMGVKGSGDRPTRFEGSKIIVVEDDPTHSENIEFRAREL
jgi:hypothetical protein